MVLSDLVQQCPSPAALHMLTAALPSASHPTVIKDFCKQLGVDNRQVQGVIRLAKKNGEKLGFLA